MLSFFPSQHRLLSGPNNKVVRARARAALIGRFWTGGN